jgi:hypothetical protein
MLVAVGLFAALCPIALAWTPGTANPTAVQGFVVDSSNRTDALSFYNTIYSASEGYAGNISWTGNVTAGAAGTTSAVFKDDVRRRINFYRALTGLPADIVFNDTKSAKCQEMALMISANKALSHSPPSSWTYYTANGAEAAANSNLHYAWGSGASTSVGPTAVDGYMTDDGSNNTIVGHRRWLLYSLSQEMGTGDVPATGTYASGNAIWVIGNFKASAPKAFIAWPNKGFVSQDLVPARWSLSYPGAGFGSAVVTMTQNGSSVPVTIISRTDNGYGDNTIVWEPSGLLVSGQQDVSFNVTVSGIGGTGVPASYSYSVTAFNPGVLGQSVTIAGPSTPAVTGQAYTFNPVTQADQYQLRVSTGSAAAWSEGAENLAAIIDRTAPDYPLAQSTVKRSGSQAFHLTFPSFAAGDQGFEINRDIIPSATSQLSFYDLFRWVTTASRLSAEISEDSGSTWTEIWARNGNGSSSSSGWETSFNARSVSLAAYAGKPVRVRFVFRSNNSAFLGTDTNTGVFLDDISISNATELVNTTTTALAGSAASFTLNATTAGASLAAGTSYYLRIRPNVGTRWFGDGPLKVVAAQAAPASPYATWQASQFTAGDIATGLTTMAADFDHDGLPNLLEYAFGKNPKVPDATGIAPNVSGNKIQISFPCDSSCTDITYTVQASSNLSAWTDIAKSVGGATTVPVVVLSAPLSTVLPDSGLGQRTVTVTETAPFTGKRFLRVKVTTP